MLTTCLDITILYSHTLLLHILISTPDLSNRQESRHQRLNWEKKSLLEESRLDRDAEFNSPIPKRSLVTTCCCSTLPTIEPWSGFARLGGDVSAHLRRSYLSRKNSSHVLWGASGEGSHFIAAELPYNVSALELPMLFILSTSSGDLRVYESNCIWDKYALDTWMR